MSVAALFLDLGPEDLCGRGPEELIGPLVATYRNWLGTMTDAWITAAQQERSSAALVRRYHQLFDQFLAAGSSPTHRQELARRLAALEAEATAARRGPNHSIRRTLPVNPQTKVLLDRYVETLRTIEHLSSELTKAEERLDQAQSLRAADELHVIVLMKRLGARFLEHGYSTLLELVDEPGRLPQVNAVAVVRSHELRIEETGLSARGMAGTTDEEIDEAGAHAALADTIAGTDGTPAAHVSAPLDPGALVASLNGDGDGTGEDVIALAARASGAVMADPGALEVAGRALARALARIATDHGCGSPRENEPQSDLEFFPKGVVPLRPRRGFSEVEVLEAVLGPGTFRE